MINLAVIAGNVGDVPFVKNMKNDKKLLSMRVATDRFKKNSKETEWHTVVCWDRLADRCEKLLQKGDFVIITGELRTRTVDAGECGNRYFTEIIASDVKRVNTGNNQEQQNENV